MKALAAMRFVIALLAGALGGCASAARPVTARSRTAAWMAPAARGGLVVALAVTKSLAFAASFAAALALGRMFLRLRSLRSLRSE